MPLRLRSLLLFAAVAVVAAAALHRAQTRRPNPSATPGGVPPLLLPVQLRGTNDLGVGKLLVASSHMGDPGFRQTVILLVHADQDAIVGLVLNRRTDTPVSSVLSLKEAKDRSDHVYAGGPVSPTTVFALYKSASRVDKAEKVFGSVYLIRDKDLFTQTIAARPDPGVFHVYLGYAGWTQAQLEHEVQLGAWYVLPPDSATVFSPDPDTLWPQMIQRTRSHLAQAEPAIQIPQPAAWF